MLDETTAAVFTPAGLHFIFTLEFSLFIRCEISGPVTDSRGLGPKPGAEVLQPCDGEMRLWNLGSCKSVRQDPRCVQLCPVKTFTACVGGSDLNRLDSLTFYNAPFYTFNASTSLYTLFYCNISELLFSFGPLLFTNQLLETMREFTRINITRNILQLLVKKYIEICSNVN